MNTRLSGFKLGSRIGGFVSWATILLFLTAHLDAPCGAGTVIIGLQDSSDWWSLNSGGEQGEGVAPGKKEFAPPNFEILGVKLGDSMFNSAAAKLGKGDIVGRGDASTGRRQLCYTSSQGQNEMYLIFEQGELDYTFYLFAGGPTWQGADRCLQSSVVSRKLETGAGLHLGQTRGQVMAILGKPTKIGEKELIYSFSVKKRTDSEDLKEARQRHPEMSDGDFQETYGFYNFAGMIVLRFVDSKLTYLAVSKVESN